MINVFESFAGIGTQRMALKNQGIEHEVTAISEVDEYALLSYHAIHAANVKVKEASEEEMQRYMEKKNIPLDPKGKRKILKNKRLKNLYIASVASNNLGDISKITDDEIPKVDLFTYSFPCSDISAAGKQKGLEKGSGTRSSLLWECERIIETVRPKYLLMENVKALVNKNNKPQFDIWLEYLEKLGYKNFWEVLNAKDYGIPQNRERVFVVSILDENADYNFPTKIPLTLRLKDMLESNVDDKYYLSQEQVDRIQFSNFTQERTRIQEKDYSDTLCARDFKDPKCVVVGGIGEKNFGKQYRQGNRIYDSGVAACLHSSPVGGAGGQSSLYIVPNNTVEPMRIGGIFDKEGKKRQAGAIWDKEGLAPTLDTMQGGWRQPSITIRSDDLKNYELIGTIYSSASKRFIGKPMKGLSKTIKATTPDTSIVYKKKGDNVDEENNERIIIGSTQKNAAINKNGVTPTLTSAMGQGGGHVPMHNCTPNFKVRKLTPNECWRLMGIADENFEKANKVVSNTQLYKQAGNAIVVDVLEEIFKELFK